MQVMNAPKPLTRQALTDAPYRNILRNAVGRCSASTTAAKVTTKKAVSVSVCYVLNDWALVKSRNGKGFYGFVTVDKLSNIRMR